MNNLSMNNKWKKKQINGSQGKPTKNRTSRKIKNSNQNQIKSTKTDTQTINIQRNHRKPTEKSIPPTGWEKHLKRKLQTHKRYRRWCPPNLMDIMRPAKLKTKWQRNNKQPYKYQMMIHQTKKHQMMKTCWKNDTKTIKTDKLNDKIMIIKWYIENQWWKNDKTNDKIMIEIN